MDNFHDVLSNVVAFKKSDNVPNSSVTPVRLALIPDVEFRSHARSAASNSAQELEQCSLMYSSIRNK